MEPFEENDIQEIEELAQKFKEAVDNGQPAYFDNTDIQDVIGFFLDTSDMFYCEKALTYALQNFPKDPYIRLLRSKYYSFQSKFVEAERELDYVEQNFEPIPELYIEKVILAHICNKDINAIELLQKSLSLDKDIPETHLLLTHEYLMQNNKDQAVKHAIRAIQLDSYAAEDIKNLFVDFADTGEPQRRLLVDFFKVMTEEMPLSGSLWSGLGLAYVGIGDFANAIDAFQLQLSVDNNDVFAYVNIAESYYGMEDYEHAIEYFELANKSSDVLQFNVQLGRCYFKLKDYDKAMRYFMTARDEDPVYATYVTPDIVKVFKIQGRFDEARAFLRDHLQKVPQDFIAIEELIDVLNPDHDDEEIKELCYTAINLMDNNLYPFFDFIVQYCCYNNYPDLGIELCENYLDDPSLAQSIHYFLAMLLIRKGQIEQGCEHLELALLTDNQRLNVDFLDVNPDLKNIPEVAHLIARYAPDSFLEN